MKFFKILRRGAVAAMAVALMTASQMWAGIVSELPTIRVNGKVMYYYDTQSGDNIYSVAEKLGVSVEEIRAYNPSVSDGVKPRMRLFFPSDIATSKRVIQPALSPMSWPKVKVSMVSPASTA